MSMLIFYAKSILFNSLVAVVVCWLPKRALFWRINRILSKCVSQETQISHRKIIGSASTSARLRWYQCSMTKHLLISGENKLAIQLTFQNILILTHHKKNTFSSLHSFPCVDGFIHKSVQNKQSLHSYQAGNHYIIGNFTRIT